MTTTGERPLATNWTPPPSLEGLVAAGRAARDRTPWQALAELTTYARDPMGILDRQDEDRVAELVPVRTERMGANPFAFYRGTAALMAADLAQSPSTALLVGSCGDAHVANFGLYGSPQRTLVFDLNDFDESAWAPWEWDLKRLVTSLVIAGRAASRDESVIEDVCLAAVRTYVDALTDGARRGPMKRYFERFDAKQTAKGNAPAARQALHEAMKEAQKRTTTRAANKLTKPGADGRRTFIEAPPTMTHVDVEVEQGVVGLFAEYIRSANVDVRALMQEYAVADIALRVVGVGSVGTRCFVLALQDGDGDAFVMQAKEAGESVLIEHGRVEQPEPVTRYIEVNGQGGRVVAMQRILQAVSDPFLGHLRRGPHGGVVLERDFYLRQFHNMQGSFDAEALEDSAFGWYADACATTLARAHGRSPGVGAVVGYVGNGKRVAEAILAWSQAYADLSYADWDRFREHRPMGDQVAAAGS